MAILAGAFAVAAVGLLDDLWDIGPLPKLLAEIGAAVGLWFAGVNAGLFDSYALNMAFTVLWVVAITNSINLLDNMDGLSSGVAAIAALTYFVIAAGSGDYLVASFALAVAGASVGFLRYNFPPARIFLGDAGSLLLGFLLASLALKLDLVGNSGVLRAAIAGLVLAVPVFDTLLVIVTRLIGKRPIYKGGTDHTSHRLVAKGMSVRDVAVGTYSAQIACCGLALMLGHVSWLVAVSALLALATVAGLGLMSLYRVPKPRARLEEPTPPAAMHTADEEEVDDDLTLLRSAAGARSPGRRPNRNSHPA